MGDQAIAELQRAVQFSGGDPSLQSELVYAYAVSGHRQDAARVLQQVLGRSRSEYVSPYGLAMAYAGLGDADITLKYLAEAYHQRDIHVPNLKVHPAFARLHGDARFQALLRQIGLPD